jgi:hypothetical protein
MKPIRLFSERRPAWYDQLTACNTLFVAGHSYNVGRLRDGLKWWEGKHVNTPARFIVYCSCKSETNGVQKKTGAVWPSNKTVVPGCAHTVSLKIGKRKPGCEGFAVDWLLAETVVLNPPVMLPNGIGRYGRMPNGKNTHLHHAFNTIKMQLSNMHV